MILITNDDGVDAQGINHLAMLMRQLGQVVVVAPDSARSGAGCSITSNTPVTLSRLSDSVWACSGTPVDCVKIALEQVVDRLPDLIVSGINHGDNASVSLHYSGTMGAVFEGCMKGVSSIGYSLQTYKSHCDFTPYDDIILRVASGALHTPLPQNVCLNVNFPEVEQLAGTRVCRMARGSWSAEWASAHNPRGKQAFWLTGQFTNLEPDSQDTDCWALQHGYAAITPLQMDMTAHRLLQEYQIPGL